MNYLSFLLLFGTVVGLVAVASNPAPYFAAFGLVMASGLGCGVLVGHGGAFLSLVLFLIYLGGMLVVFAYSAALSAEPFPEAWGGRSVFVYVVAYLMSIFLAAAVLGRGWYQGSWFVGGGEEFALVRMDSGGVALLYEGGGVMLLLCGWVLFLTLLVVLELTRGSSRGTLRAI